MVGFGSNLIDDLVELNGRQRSIVVDEHRWKTVGSPPDEHVPCKAHRGAELPAGNMANHLGRVATIDRNSEDPPVGTFIVDDNPEDIVAVIDRILDTFNPREDRARLGRRLARRDHPGGFGNS